MSLKAIDLMGVFKSYYYLLMNTSKAVITLLKARKLLRCVDNNQSTVYK